MAESYELRDIEPDLARQQGEDDQRQRLLSKTSDELLDEEIRQLQGEVDGDETYQPRKSSESDGDRDYDMDEMVNRVSPMSASRRIYPSYTLTAFRNITLSRTDHSKYRRPNPALPDIPLGLLGNHLLHSGCSRESGEFTDVPSSWLQCPLRRRSSCLWHASGLLLQ